MSHRSSIVLVLVLVGSALAAPGTNTAPATGPAAPATGSADKGRVPLAPPSLVPSNKPTLAMRPAQVHGGFVADMDCSACHTTGGWNLATTAGASGFDHDRTGFPLRGAHAQRTCGACHTGKATPPTMCEGCHRDPHEGRHDETCASCHTAAAWTDVNALAQHRRTRMPLTGKHAVIDCTSCHRRQGGRTFSDLSTDCYACHRDRYNDPATHPNHNGTGTAMGTALFPRDCGLCHQTTAWSPAFADPNKLPREALARTGGHDMYMTLSTGSHRAAACESCHVDARRMTSVRCDGCHDDLALRKQHKGATRSRAATTCLRCHPRGAAR